MGAAKRQTELRANAVADQRRACYSTLPVSFLAGLNFTTRLAAMVIFSPVCGFLPTCSALSMTRKEPNPEMVTFSPFFMASVILAITLSRALRAAAWVIFPLIDIRLTSSFLFMAIPFIVTEKSTLSFPKNNCWNYQISTRCFYLVSVHKWHFSPNSSLLSKFNPRSINYMPPVKFIERLDLEQNYSFLDRHYLFRARGFHRTQRTPFQQDTMSC